MKQKEAPRFVIQNWMRNRNTVEFLAVWEELHNPNFNRVQFEAVRNEAGHPCTFRTNIEQSKIDNFVAGVISSMVHDPQFETAIKDKIGIGRFIS